MSFARRLLLAGTLTTLAACHQTFTTPDQPDLAKVPLRFEGVDLSAPQQGSNDMAVPVEKDLGQPHLDLPSPVDQG